MMQKGRQLEPVLIVGGGIGGLSAALALADQGIASHVLEADETFREYGAGIQIGPNGTHCLRKWGLGDALDEQAAKPDALLIGDGLSGKQLTRIPLGAEAERRYGAPYYVAERALLHRLLYQQAAQHQDITLTTGFALRSFREEGDRIAVMPDLGYEIVGVALIGADGVQSKTRRLLFGRQPFQTGRRAWRSTVEIEPSRAVNDNAVQLWLGSNAHLVHYCCGPTGPLNAVAITHGQTGTTGWGAPGEAYDLKPHFADWDDEAFRLLQNFDSWKYWPLLNMQPLQQWSEGRVTLLGDAAHPIMPFLASGAVMAIEDAAILAAELARSLDDPATAFRTYEARRRGRIARVRRGASQMGQVYHMSGVMRRARNLVLASAPVKQLIARNDWLYGYRPVP